MKRRGFTLIELLVAIGIIVLLSVIALASTRSLRGSLRFSTAVNTTTALLERARSEAIRRGEPVMAAFRPVVIGLMIATHGGDQLATSHPRISLGLKWCSCDGPVKPWSFKRLAAAATPSTVGSRSRI